MLLMQPLINSLVREQGFGELAYYPQRLLTFKARKIMNIYNVGLIQQGQILLGIALSIGFVSSPLLVVMFLMWWEKQLEKLS